MMILALTLSLQSRTGLVPSSLIVGRAVCGQTTWLLTDMPELVEVPHADPQRLVVRRLQGLLEGDKVWGLACLGDGSLWTLPSARTLARLDPGARLLSRTAMRLPKLALFGLGEWLLQQQLPIVVGTPALIAASARRPNEATPWPGLRARAATTREREIARNLVVCGIPFEQTLPCWFADARETTWSDGSSTKTVPVSSFLSAAADREAPVRDIALVGRERYWLLEAGPGPRGVAGTRLSLIDAASVHAAVELKPAARTIVAATASRCLLVTTEGALAEWIARP